MTTREMKAKLKNVIDNLSDDSEKSEYEAVKRLIDALYRERMGVDGAFETTFDYGADIYDWK